MNVTKDRVIPLFFHYAIPSILGMLAISSASVVDAIFVGNFVGSTALASINISSPIFSILFGLALCLAIGGSVISGKYMGENKIEKASNIFSKVLIAIVVLSSVISIIIYNNTIFILTSFGAVDELLALSSSYIKIMLIFMPFLMTGIVLSYFVKIDSRPNLSFFALVSTSVVNVVLDYFLIVYFDFGIKGAAYATGISYLFLIFITLPHFFSKKATLKFIKPNNEWFSLIKAMLNGASEFINEISVGITTIVFNFIMIKNFSVDGVAAFTVINYLLFIGLMIVFGISDSLQPLISKNFGAKQIKRVRSFFILSSFSVFAVGFSMSMITLFFSSQLADIFLAQEEVHVKEVVVQFAMFVWPAFLFHGFNLTISAYFTALHKPIPSGVIALLRSLILPIFFIFTLPLYFGSTGVFMAIAFSEFFTLLVAIILYKRYKITSF